VCEVEKLLARQHAPGPIEKHEEQVELGACQFDRLSVETGHMARIWFGSKASEAIDAGAIDAWLAISTPAQNGTDARHELARIERLAEVVVGADLQADDAVDVLLQGRQPLVAFTASESLGETWPAILCRHLADMPR
jgi:hypothetical protein